MPHHPIDLRRLVAAATLLPAAVVLGRGVRLLHGSVLAGRSRSGHDLPPVPLPSVRSPDEEGDRPTATVTRAPGPAATTPRRHP